MTAPAIFITPATFVPTLPKRRAGAVGVGPVVGAGVVLGVRGVGDGDPDGDQVFVLAGQALNVEGGQQLLLKRFGHLGKVPGR